MLPQQKFREMVLQLLYSADFSPLNEDEMVELLMGELEISKKNVRLAQSRAQEIISELPTIDSLIASTSTSYDFDRIHQVTKNILRIAVYEMLHDPQVPHKVSISEALRLARKFGSVEAVSFINAILDQIRIQHPREESLTEEK